MADMLTSNVFIFSGKFDSSQRSEFVNRIRSDNLYTIIGAPIEQDLDGRRVRVYTVKVSIAAYNRALKNYLELSGFPEIAGQVLQGGDDANSPTFEVAIEPGKRLVRSVGFPNLNSSRVENYPEWNQPYSFAPPENAITTEEFQKRISEL